MADAETDSLVELRDALRRFAAERDWDQFHTPRSLAISLSLETAELLEHYQWREVAEDPGKLRDEVADVLLYLVRFADRLGIDLAQAARDKIEVNAVRYPVAEFRGSSRKSRRS